MNHRWLQANAVGLLLAPMMFAQDPPGYVPLDKAKTAKFVFASTSGPAVAGYLGIHVQTSGNVVSIVEVQTGSPAEQAGLKAGDILLKIDGKSHATADSVREVLQAKRAGDAVRFNVDRKQQPLELTATMAATSRPVSPSSAPPTPPIKGKKTVTKADPPAQLLVPWKKENYRLAVIVVEFPDHAAIMPTPWSQILFNRGVVGLNDYFTEQSYGKFRVEGKVFAPVKVAKNRADYAQGSGTTNKTVPLAEALNLVIARDGPEALAGFDGLAFLYAGPRIQTNRGNIYYPHRASLVFQKKNWPYILAPEGGPKIEPLGTFALEFAKLLGLPDLSARPENPGSEGLGVWCLMSNGGSLAGGPAHLSAWCKERLGWLKPVVLDPNVKQKLILASVASGAGECAKIPIRADGSEYLLLENRDGFGFDRNLPGKGLLIWRVVQNRPVLEESHGIEGPAGPMSRLDAVPYPSRFNNAFTPITMPSSRSLAGGGMPVHINDIRRLADGRIAFSIGYEFQ